MWSQVFLPFSFLLSNCSHLCICLVLYVSFIPFFLSLTPRSLSVYVVYLRPAVCCNPWDMQTHGSTRYPTTAVCTLQEFFAFAYSHRTGMIRNSLSVSKKATSAESRQSSSWWISRFPLGVSCHPTATRILTSRTRRSLISFFFFPFFSPYSIVLHAKTSHSFQFHQSLFLATTHK